MKLIVTAGELRDKGMWTAFAGRYDHSEQAVNEGLVLPDEEFTITEAEGREFGFLPDEEAIREDEREREWERTMRQRRGDHS